MRYGCEAKRADVKDEVQGCHQTVEDETRHLVSFKPEMLMGEYAHHGDEQGGNSESPEGNFNGVKGWIGPEHQHWAGGEKEHGNANIDQTSTRGRIWCCRCYDG